ncbi:Mitochondrial intermediate peptidase [Neophaeococcomyces mojaviensis]|uniref:Mitochondrial intermediate peptidase n=1 Tax=Neophaeococcomyces mojaviensis TaxID=3383035 RepID=A0ACC3A6C8_9EURO|nr:Mitochondrial intermediate peptidase [Knufia sp. JES_112]
MNQISRRQGWTCAKCLRRIQKRTNSTVAATPTTSSSSYEDAYLAGSRKLPNDNAVLRDVFNKQSVWKDFSTGAKTTAGLIGNSHLTEPRGFQRFAESSLRKCKELVQRVLAASTLEEYKNLPRDLDRLSDLLCRVIDLSDFVRTIHPNQGVAAAASAAYSLMFQYMNELNTTTGLNKQLKKAWAIPELQSQWTQEEKMVATILMKDFSKSGIDLPDSHREEFVSISNDIANIGTDFVNNMEYANGFVNTSRSQLAGIESRHLQSVGRWSKASIPVYSSIGKHILGNAHDSDIKRQLYTAERTASKSTIKRLEQLLLKRAKLAQLTGYGTYAHLTLTDKMSKTPEAVTKFLQSLNANNKGQVQAELDRLLQIKQQREPGATEVNAWEHNYLTNLLKQQTASQRAPKSRLLGTANNYFAVGHVIQGLSSLFESLYGVRLVPRETKIGEVWHPDVRRLDVYTEAQEHIATMYCDLFSRPGKLPNPAHFTLLCSREISAEEVEDSFNHNQPINLGMPVRTSIDRVTGQTKHYQTPIIALVCDFTDNSGASEPSTLSPLSVTTLFHEMGHAVHSILGQTSMQGISGTRCATDFAELPSVLMEYFATDPAVLKLFARHWQTDELIPDELIDAMRQDKEDRAAMTGGWDNQTQILMALLDQVYHADGPVRGLSNDNYDSTGAFHDVWNRYSTVREPAGTAWQGFFGHLYGYGATYYAYLFDRAIARQVWRAVFRDGENGGAVDREAGEKFKQEVLRWGGGKDPWLCLEALMGERKGVLAEGGADAMDLVGQWGVGAGSEGQM